VVAGVELVRGFDSWDWSGLTFAVADVAGRMFRSLGSFAVANVTSPPNDDPTFVAVDETRRPGVGDRSADRG
jgi:hypothetical protein